MFSKLIATAAIVAAPSAVYAVPCNFGKPNSAGRYAMEFPDDLLTEEECAGLKVHLMRWIWLNAPGNDHANWATMAGYTGVVTGYEWIADEGCHATASVGGGACMTWADADSNATHPLGLSGLIPVSHGLVPMCINNAAVLDKVAGHWLDVGTSGAFEDGGKESPNYVEGDAVHDVGWQIRNFMGAAMPYCSNQVFGADPIWSCTMPGQKDTNTPLDFGAASMGCCTALHTMVALDAHAGKNGMGQHLSMVNNNCPAHGADYGGCEEGTRNKPTEIAEVNAIDAIRSDDCACGATVMTNAPDSDFKKLLNADNDAVLDMCTTSTTAAPTAASDDSGAAGLVASFSAMAVAVAASFM